MGFRRFIGTLFIVLGALNVVNFWAPRPIPTVGPSAIMVGLLCLAAGLYLRADRDASGRIRWDRLKALLSSRAAKGTGRKSSVDPLLAVRTLRLASARGGRLTVAQTAMELDVPIDQAEGALDECVSKGSAFIEVDEPKGIVSYRFPEFLNDPS